MLKGVRTARLTDTGAKGAARLGRQTQSSTKLSQWRCGLNSIHVNSLSEMISLRLRYKCLELDIRAIATYIEVRRLKVLWSDREIGPPDPSLSM